MYSFGEDWYSRKLVMSFMGVLDGYNLGLCWNGLSRHFSQRHIMLGLLHFEQMGHRSCGGFGSALIGKMRDFFGFLAILWF